MLLAVGYWLLALGQSFGFWPMADSREPYLQKYHKWWHNCERKIWPVEGKGGQAVAVGRRETGSAMISSNAT